MRVKQNGFTLIEVILGMTVTVIAIGLILSAMLPREKQSAEQIHMIRAAELGKSLVAEISAKRFDENSDPSLFLRCNEIAGSPCTSGANFGVDDVGEAEDAADRFTFDDVDDYHLLQLTDLNLESHYKGFTVDIRVTYDNDFDGLPDGSDLSGTVGSSLAKRIVVLITTPLSTPVEFVFFRANY